MSNCPYCGKEMPDETYCGIKITTHCSFTCLDQRLKDNHRIQLRVENLNKDQLKRVLDFIQRVV